MSQLNLDQPNHKVADPQWKELYRIGGIVAVATVILILLVIVTFPIWPYLPGTTSVENIFAAIQANRLGGLLSLDFILLINNLIGVLLFLALYVSLKQVNESYALIALVLGLLAVGLIVPARPIFELVSLSDLYATAITDVAKDHYLAGGEAMLAYFDGTAYKVNTFLGGLSLLISSLLMLRSNIFSKATAYVGIVTNLAVCGFLLPGIGIALLTLSVPGYLIWNIQLARSFFKMAKKGDVEWQ
ncbi:MAG: DUF4386 family protein [Anaerolineae bacterium]|nr:DUF4386 family protein [Anaerolineae bacterium]